jgi:hypothetical protein
MKHRIFKLKSHAKVLSKLSDVITFIDANSPGFFGRNIYIYIHEKFLFRSIIIHKTRRFKVGLLFDFVIVFTLSLVLHNLFQFLFIQLSFSNSVNLFVIAFR